MNVPFTDVFHGPAAEPRRARVGIEASLFFCHANVSGYKEGTREPIMGPTPYVFVYGVEPEIVHISRVFHASTASLEGARMKLSPEFARGKKLGRKDPTYAKSDV